MEFQDRVVWITGASSGIGEALAYAFARQGAILILSARREAELQRVKAACSQPDRVHVAPLDLSQTEAVDTLVAQWYQRLGRIDLLVNNGGISQRGLAHQTEMPVNRRMMEVNFFGQIALSRALMPYFLQQQSGHFVVISSITGKFGFMLRSAYAASKHALHGYFESLYLESRDQGIQVTMINPGRIATAISLHALQADGSPQGREDPSLAAGMSPERCAEQILRAVKRGRYEITIGTLGERLMVWFKRLVPSLFHFIAAKVPAR
jgi:dehydrogenase/reductase SDR family member 7B